MQLPFPRTWWIDPGKVIGGRYPGTPDPAESRRMLAALVACGVRTVVNLQEEGERGAGGAPFRDYRRELSAAAAQAGAGVDCHRFPVPDCDVPDPPLMAEVLSVIRRSADAGWLVYVHCWGGHGRTGTVAGCWLVERGATPEEAFDHIKQRRAHDPHLAKEPAPQTAAQRRFVSAWKSGVGERQVPRDAPPQTAAATAAATPMSAATPPARPAGKPPEPTRTVVPNPQTAVSLDRALGTLLGLAVGDAVGAAAEFEPPGTFVPLTDMVGGGPFGLKPGEWTDDTSMALCLAESLSERGYFDPVDQLGRYVRWWKEGHFSVKGHCFDIGNQVKAALAEHVSTGMPFCGPIGPRNAGNGSLMRLCPVAIAYAGSPAAAVVYAGESSRTTHGNRECVDACRYFAGLLVGAMRGGAKDDLLAAGYSPVPGLWAAEALAPKVAAVAAGSFKGKAPPQIKGTGYVVDCLEAALWAFHTTDSFEAAVLRAANLGDDADTTAAVCGQIAGAAYGAAAIPEKWLAKLAERETIRSLATALVGGGAAARRGGC